MVEEVGRIVRRRERRPGAPSGQARVHWSAVGLAIVQVDAFTDTPFRGNPAAVCVLPTPRDERWMQEVAREMNLSETAFLHGESDGFGLRWFTPTVEVPLCGHATLASAHVLWEDGLVPLRARPVLERAPRQVRAPRLPGLRPRGRRPRPPRG